MIELEPRLRDAVRHFWMTRATQSKKQGTKTGRKDAGDRAAATGGAQLNGFVRLISDLLTEAGIAAPEIFIGKGSVVLPGWFRPSKQWDLLVVADKKLIATIELKSHIGSFGNNYNNRTEEALGNATDLLAAYREGAFKESLRPWLGYLMLVEDAPKSRNITRVRSPHFPVFEEFKKASYINRYDITLTKLVRERLYDAACLITSTREGGQVGQYLEPSGELSFRNFAESLLARAIAHVKTESSTAHGANDTSSPPADVTG